MCMEDIKLGRQTVARTVSESVSNGSSITIPSNGRRVGLMISAQVTVAGTVCNIFRESVSNANYVDHLSPERPSVLYRIEIHGTLLQSRFVVNNGSGFTANLSFTEMTLLENPSNINGEAKVQHGVGRPATRESSY